MEVPSCAHRDVRRFDNVQCCLECGETLYLSRPSQTKVVRQEPRMSLVSTSIVHLYDDIRLSTEQKIRLVILAPGGFQDPIWCTIVTVDLHPVPTFEALSYTWATEDGDIRKTGRIHCPFGVLPVTENCEVALRTLRWSTKPRTLWVGLMQQIYSNAIGVQVVITDPSQSYAEGLRFPAEGQHGYGEATAQILRLFSLRYFSRVWIIQEILLARSVIIHINGDQFELSRATIQPILRLYEASSIEPPKLLNAIQHRLGTTEYLGISLGAGCSDPRDVVFGIISLLDETSRQLIPVDYSLSLTDIMTNAVMACIAEKGDLSILKFVTRCGIHPQDAHEDVKKRSQFNLADFKKYITNDYQKGHHAPWLSDVVDRPWCEAVFVSQPHQLQSFEATSIKLKPTKSFIRKIPASLPPGQIFPRLRVRAHLLDIVQNPICDSVKECIKTIRSKNYSRSHMAFSNVPEILANCFQARTTWNDGPSEKLASHFGTQQRDKVHKILEDRVHMRLKGLLPSVDEWALRQFLDGVRYWSSIEEHGFFTHYSIGCSEGQWQSGDHVFAIDGLGDPILLRPVGPEVYRPINRCYLWKAMNLDYWYPGTYKGLWLDRPVDLGEQTRMIEIY